MDVRNCKKCGRIFNYISGPPICPSCKEKYEEKFQEVKKYVWENKGAGLVQISEECGVEVQQIRRWIREERLTFSDDSPVGIECESCGTMIKTGRFCEKCRSNMAKSFSPDEPNKKKIQAAPEKKKDNKGKMRFLDM